MQVQIMAAGAEGGKVDAIIDHEYTGVMPLAQIVGTLVHKALERGWLPAIYDAAQEPIVIVTENELGQMVYRLVCVEEQRTNAIMAVPATDPGATPGESVEHAMRTGLTLTNGYEAQLEQGPCTHAALHASEADAVRRGSEPATFPGTCKACGVQVWP